MNRDANSIPELTERQLYILAALIRTYIQHPEPVSSKQIVDEQGLNVSSATVRNELAMLEQLGMIRSPHTSAGRVPTEEGYRYFVQNLLTEQDLSLTERQRIKDEFRNAAQDIQKWLRTATNVLARGTSAAAFVTEPRSQSVFFKHLQLIGIHGSLVMLVLVLEGGELTQQMLTLKDAVDQEQLSQVATRINDICHGETSAGVRQKSLQINEFLAKEVMELAAEIMQESDANGSLAIHWYGFSELLPRFEEGFGAQQALRILDEKALIDEVLRETIATDDDDVRVLIGGEGREELSELSLVISRYGTRSMAGAISVLGPIRMRYGRAISTVRYVSTLMTAMIQDIYGNTD